MNTFVDWVDRINEAVGQAVKWLAVFMVLVTMLVVVLRYGFNVGAIALQESVMYMHGILFLLGIPYALKHGAHVRVDILYTRLQPPRQALIDLIGHCRFLLPVATFIFVTSLPYVAASWRVLEGSAEVGGVPGIFLLKTLIPVMAALLALQGLAEICKALLKLRAQATAEEHS